MHMRYCSYCGSPLKEGAVFCSSCGRKVDMDYQENGSVQNESLLQDENEYETINVLPGDLPFQLQTGEKVHAIITPEKNQFIVKFTIGLVSGLAFLYLFLAVILLIKTTPNDMVFAVDVLVILGVIFLVVILVTFFVANIAYNKYYYGITNHRVVGQRGIIGYIIDSIPLENIADVIISRQILDRMLGISSLVITPIGGSIVGTPGYGTNTFSGSNVFQALLPDKAVDIQQLIFNLRDRRKKETGRII
ncbi:MAG: PH domain-containing protein [Thermoplasmata archaeon]